MSEDNIGKYITEHDVETVKDLLLKNLADYEQKPKELSDRNWIADILRKSDMSSEKADIFADGIMSAVAAYNNNLRQINESAQSGISKERWLSEKIMQAKGDIPISEYGKTLDEINSSMYGCNMQISEALGTPQTEEIQEDEIINDTEHNYTELEAQELSLSIAKNTNAYALQSAVITTGFDIVKEVVKGNEITPSKLVEIALKSGDTDTLKAIVATTLTSASENNLNIFGKELLSPEMITNLSCVGVENAGTLLSIATGKLTVTKGLEMMGRSVFAMIGNVLPVFNSSILLAPLTAVFPAAPVVSGVVSMLVSHVAQKAIGEVVHEASKKVATVAKTVAKAAVSGLKKVGRAVYNTARKVGSFIKSIFG